jgi:hypothetical protein
MEPVSWLFLSHEPTDAPSGEGCYNRSEEFS